MNNSRSVVWLAVATEDTKPTACTRGIAKRRERKRGKTNNGESERPDSTVDVGELALSKDPAEGSGMSHQTFDVGNYGRCAET